MAKKRSKQTPAKKKASARTAKRTQRVAKKSARAARKTGTPKKAKAAKRAMKAKTAKPTKARRPAPAKRTGSNSQASRKLKVGAVRTTTNRVAAKHVGTVAAPALTDRRTKRPRRLTPKDLVAFRDMLLEKRAQLVGDVGTLHDEALRKTRRDAAGDLSSMPIHMADLGTDNYELEFTLGLIEGERAVLKEIDEALERINQGTYGLCLATGKPIGKARLRAQPWAKYCYEYMLEQEQGKQRRL